MFFVLAGMELDPLQFLNPVILIMGTVFILCRGAGKYGGVYAGCAVVRLEPRIKTYLGFCMLPQAGVAIGLVDIVSGMLQRPGITPEVVAAITSLNSIILMSVFVNEILGPPLSRFALIRGNNMEV